MSNTEYRILNTEVKIKVMIAGIHFDIQCSMFDIQYSNF
jgi:hypothetical protein